jgi:hypothetical protein
MEAKLIRLQPVPFRRPGWWLEPLATGAALAVFIAYALWASLQGGDYYVEPYLSPLYSPCIAASCAHVSASLVGSWWTWSPALLVLWVPAGLRATCYSYRKSYYRSYFLSPPGCSVPDAASGYSGETRFPLVLQNLHRYFFYLSLLVLAFLWWDAMLAFRFADGIGVGVGTLVMVTNATLLTLYALSCNSCRHACGGHLKSFDGSPLRYQAWRVVSRLNERHAAWAWVSLAWVCAADLYVRLLASGAIVDLRIL